MKTTNPAFDDTLSHIVCDALCMPRDGVFERAVKTFPPMGDGSINAVSLTRMGPTQVDDLHYVDDNGVTMPLPHLVDKSLDEQDNQNMEGANDNVIAT